MKRESYPGPRQHVGCSLWGSGPRSNCSRVLRPVADELGYFGVKNGAHVVVPAEDRSLIVPAMIGILARGCLFTLLDLTYPNLSAELSPGARGGGRPREPVRRGHDVLRRR